MKTPLCSRNNPPCSHCARGERTEPADVLIVGSLDGRPIRSWVCADHLTMLRDDGATVRAVRYASDTGRGIVSDQLWAEYVKARDFARMRGKPSPRNLALYRQAVAIHSRWLAVTPGE